MMPGGPDGLATLEQLKRVAPELPVVMMSGKANLADAVRATKLGAFQFLEKPLTPEACSRRSGPRSSCRARSPRTGACTKPWVTPTRWWA